MTTMPAIRTTTPNGSVQRKQESSVPPVAAVRGPSFTRGMDTEGGGSVLLLLLLALTARDGQSGMVMASLMGSWGISGTGFRAAVLPSVG